MVWSTRSIAKISSGSQKIQPGDPPKENGSYWQREKESTIRLEKAKFSAKQWVEDDKSEKAESQPETRTSCRFGIVTQDWRCCETKAACGCSKRWKPLFVDICSCVNGNLISVPFIEFYVLLSVYHWYYQSLRSDTYLCDEVPGLGEERSVRWGRRKLEKVTHVNIKMMNMYCSAFFY